MATPVAKQCRHHSTADNEWPTQTHTNEASPTYRCPNLGRKEEHARVKAPAATRARLKQHVRMLPSDATEHLVYAHQEAMGHFPLALCREVLGEDLGEMTVHVPFDVLNVAAGEDPIHLIVDVVTHALARKVQHQLVAPGRPPP